MWWYRFLVKRLRVNSHVARVLNRATILDLLRTRRVLSRTEISHETGFGKATISEVIDQFISEGFVRVLGPGESRGGRRPELLEFDPRARLVIGLEMGDTICSAVLTDLNGNPIRKLTATVRAVSADEVIAAASALVSELRANVPKSSLLGIGVGTPGLVDSESGVIRMAPDLGWQDVPAGQQLADQLDMTVAIVNRAKAAALGEAWCGAGRKVGNLAYVSVSTGISAGIIIDGRLYRGVSMSEGEFGHVTVEPDGPLCRCGNHGCLQAMAARDAVLSRIMARIRAGQPTSLTVSADGKLDLLTLAMVAEAAAAGDRLVLDVADEIARYIGIAAANLINILNPQMLIFGGSIIRALPAILPVIAANIAHRVMAVPGAAVTIVPSQLGQDVVPIGAAAYLLGQISIIGSTDIRPMVTTTSHTIQPHYGS